MTTDSNTQAALEAGVLIADPHVLDEGKRFVSIALPDGGSVNVFDLEKMIHEAGLADHPTRKKGSRVVDSPEAFIAYMAKHALPGTEVWANVTNQTVTAVINADLGTTGDGVEDYAGWGDHRLVYGLHSTPAWSAWLGLDGQWLDQVAFAEHVEDRIIDVVEPAGATMLEIAQTFIANRTVAFESSKRLKSGETQLEYREAIDAAAGATKSLAIPDELTLGIQPFEGSQAYKITARFRYRIANRQLKLSFKLNRPEDITRLAFDDVRKAIADGIQGDVWEGRAP